jgi:hypothetical protein
MIARAWLLACLIPCQLAGFLTLTPPEEALDNLGKWWKFIASLMGGVKCPKRRSRLLECLRISQS